VTFWKPLRTFYIRTTNLTHGFQENRTALDSFYKLWAPLYDLSVSLDSGYKRNLSRMVKRVVQASDCVLDVGCGTGLATLAAAKNAKEVVALDPSQAMRDKLAKKIGREKLRNVEVRNGFFPEGLEKGKTYETANHDQCSPMRYRRVSRSYEPLDISASGGNRFLTRYHRLCIFVNSLLFLQNYYLIRKK